MGKRLYQWLFRLTGVKSLYQDLVVEDRLKDIRTGIRSDLTALLESIDRDNPFFKGIAIVAKGQNAATRSRVFHNHVGRQNSCFDKRQINPPRREKPV